MESHAEEIGAKPFPHKRHYQKGQRPLIKIQNDLEEKIINCMNFNLFERFSSLKLL